MAEMTYIDLSVQMGLIFMMNVLFMLWLRSSLDRLLQALFDRQVDFMAQTMGTPSQVKNAFNRLYLIQAQISNTVIAVTRIEQELGILKDNHQQDSLNDNMYVFVATGGTMVHFVDTCTSVRGASLVQYHVSRQLGEWMAYTHGCKRCSYE